MALGVSGYGFSLNLIPTFVGDGPDGVRRFCATHVIRFYVESGQSLEFDVSTVGAAGAAVCSVSGYYLDT